jgi:type I restriction enzyme, S subunit
VKAGWTNKPIGDVFKVVNGGTPKTGVASNWDGSHAWITPAEMGNLDTPYISESRRALTDEGLRTGAELVPAGSIILSSRAPIGHLVINEIPMAFNQGCKGLIPKSGIDTKFAYYFMLTNVPLFESLGTGTTFKELSSGKLKEVPFQFPELGEQRRIVALLDEAFADIATAKANAEKNLQNARELCEGLMQALFPDDENVAPDSPTLDSLCELIVDCEHKTAPTQETGIPSIRTPNIGKGRLILEGVYRVSDETYAEWTRRGEPQGGDLILAREAPAGNVAVIPESTKVCLGQRTVLIRPKKSIFEPAYLAQLLLRQNSQRRLLAHSRGATVQHINMKDIRAFKIGVIPSVTDQQRVVSQVNELFDTEDRLVSIYSQKLAALDDLKKSLLHQALSGQL